jgi:tRNA(fMet)-specific endonuclease VapC
MLDTNIVSELIRNPAGVVAGRIAEAGDAGMAVSIIVAAELRFGGAKLGSAALIRQIEAILSGLLIIPFETPADAEYASIRSALERQGRSIGGNDLLIVAHALAVGVPLVTRNIDEFSRVPGLRVVNWA